MSSFCWSRYLITNNRQLVCRLRRVTTVTGFPFVGNMSQLVVCEHNKAVPFYFHFSYKLNEPEIVSATESNVELSSCLGFVQFLSSCYTAADFWSDSERCTSTSDVTPWFYWAPTRYLLHGGRSCSLLSLLLILQTHSWMYKEWTNYLTWFLVSWKQPLQLSQKSRDRHYD